MLELLDALSFLQQALALTWEVEELRSKHGENHLRLRLIDRGCQVGRMRMLLAQLSGEMVVTKCFSHMLPHTHLVLLATRTAYR